MLTPMTHLILAGITAFLVVLLATPSLIKVAFLKRLFDEPGDARKLHKRVVPTIGGIIIFAATLFACSLWFPFDKPEAEVGVTGVRLFQFVVATLIIMFFVGIKDDIIGTAPIKKLAAHVIVGMILVLMAETRIHSMHGLFGINDIPLWASIFLSLFTFIVVVNAYNLIDGVDGLAAGVGLIGATTLGVAFACTGQLVPALLAFSLSGALAAFLVFNFSPAKIFMGDSGSLSIGLIMSILVITFIESTPPATTPAWMKTLVNPVVGMAVLAYPLTDTLRIFGHRALRGVSPFSADRNHLHHLLIDSGMSHAKTVIWIYIANVAVIGLAVYTSLVMNITSSFIITGGTVVLLTLVPWMLKRQHTSKQKQEGGKTRHINEAAA
jgi:UDP-N-acetylmuramyl pentapeptide phosphotransferase/UDP-N-acetylglucosamine-1-phosphate transferase